jgi:hypothetical protein
MAATVRIKLEIEVVESYTGDLGNPGKTHRISKDLVFVSGNGSSQFNKVHSDMMYVGGDANSVPVFGAAADFAKIGPQGFFLAVNPVDGWTVTAATGDVVEVNHNAGTWDHAVILAGRS